MQHSFLAPGLLVCAAIGKIKWYATMQYGVIYTHCARSRLCHYWRVGLHLEYRIFVALGREAVCAKITLRYRSFCGPPFLDPLMGSAVFFRLFTSHGTLILHDQVSSSHASGVVFCSTCICSEAAAMASARIVFKIMHVTN